MRWTNGGTIAVVLSGVLDDGAAGGVGGQGRWPRRRPGSGSAGSTCWFTVADSLPLLSIDAERAAAKLVDAAPRGKPEVVLTPAAKLATRLHGLASSTTMRLIALTDRLLPTDETPDPPTPGRLAERPARWFEALTSLTPRAARRFHQHDDPTPAPPAAPDRTGHIRRVPLQAERLNPAEPMQRRCTTWLARTAGPTGVAARGE